MSIVAIRGAINLDSNTKEEILSSTEELLKLIISENNLDIENIVSIIFTSTKDLTKSYPAPAARNLGIVNAGLICLNEMYVEASMEKCIRILLYYKSKANQKDVKHVYLRDTHLLRPDLKTEEDLYDK